MRQQWFTHVRLLIAHPPRSQRDVNRSAHHPGSGPTQPAVVRNLRPHGNPAGPTSITGTARIVPTIFYIIIITSLQDTRGCRKLCGGWSGGISVLVDESATAGRSNDLEVPIWLWLVCSVGGDGWSLIE